MYLLYADTSGNTGAVDEKNFVGGAVSIKETGIYHVINELEQIIKKSPLKLPPEIELHGYEIVRGKNYWRRFAVADRLNFYKECLQVFRGNSSGNLKCFGAAIEKSTLKGKDPVDIVFEQLCSRFNSYLQRVNSKVPTGAKHRGLLIFDESKYEGSLQQLAREYRVNGTRWGSLRNLAEVPLFADSKASRLIQLADLVSYALWQRYERDDAQ